jgi:hypothetical protein
MPLTSLLGYVCKGFLEAADSLQDALYKGGSGISEAGFLSNTYGTMIAKVSATVDYTPANLNAWLEHNRFAVTNAFFDRIVDTLNKWQQAGEPGEGKSSVAAILAAAAALSTYKGDADAISDKLDLLRLGFPAAWDALTVMTEADVLDELGQEYTPFLEAMHAVATGRAATVGFITTPALTTQLARTSLSSADGTNAISNDGFIWTNGGFYDVRFDLASGECVVRGSKYKLAVRAVGDYVNSASAPIASQLGTCGIHTMVSYDGQGYPFVARALFLQAGTSAGSAYQATVYNTAGFTAGHGSGMAMRMSDSGFVKIGVQPLRYSGAAFDMSNITAGAEAKGTNEINLIWDEDIDSTYTVSVYDGATTVYYNAKIGQEVVAEIIPNAVIQLVEMNWTNTSGYTYKVTYDINGIDVVTVNGSAWASPADDNIEGIAYALRVKPAGGNEGAWRRASILPEADIDMMDAVLLSRSLDPVVPIMQSIYDGDGGGSNYEFSNADLTYVNCEISQPWNKGISAVTNGRIVDIARRARTKAFTSIRLGNIAGSAPFTTLLDI